MNTENPYDQKDIEAAMKEQILRATIEALPHPRSDHMSEAQIAELPKNEQAAIARAKAKRARRAARASK